MIDFSDTYLLQGLFKWLKKYSTKKVRSLRYLWGSLFGQRNFERFAIVGHARTGSSFLAAGLDSSISTRLHPEIFAEPNREIGKDFEKNLSLLFQKQHRSIRAVGFKLFYFHLSEDEWEKFSLHDDIKIIHITRRNILRTIVSLEIAQKTNQWHTSFLIIKPEIKKIVLDVKRLLERFEEILAYEEITRNRFKDRNILEITYEDLIKDPESEFKRIEKYLNIKGIDPKRITLRKQNPENLYELIENYAEVSQQLAETKFAHFLLG